MRPRSRFPPLRIATAPSSDTPEVVWEETLELGRDFVRVQPMLSDFFCGNAYDEVNNVIRTYTVTATDGGSSPSPSIWIPAR